MAVQIQSIGVIEVTGFANAVFLTDSMLKAADVEVLSVEKLLGGRLVTVVVGGTVSQVEEAVAEANRQNGNLEKEPMKAAFAIPNPHCEILKYIIKAERQEDLISDHLGTVRK